MRSRDRRAQADRARARPGKPGAAARFPRRSKRRREPQYVVTMPASAGGRGGFARPDEQLAMIDSMSCAHELSLAFVPSLERHSAAFSCRFVPASCRGRAWRHYATKAMLSFSERCTATQAARRPRDVLCPGPVPTIAAARHQRRPAPLLTQTAEPSPRPVNRGLMRGTRTVVRAATDWSRSIRIVPALPARMVDSRQSPPPRRERIYAARAIRLRHMRRQCRSQIHLGQGACAHRHVEAGPHRPSQETRRLAASDRRHPAWLSARHPPPALRRSAAGNDGRPAGAVIFGGPQSANDTRISSNARSIGWRAAARQEALSRICLGAQMMGVTWERVVDRIQKGTRNAAITDPSTEPDARFATTAGSRVPVHARASACRTAGVAGRGEPFRSRRFVTHRLRVAVSSESLRHDVQWWCVRASSRLRPPAAADHVSGRAVHDYASATADGVLDHWLGRAAAQTGT